MDLLDELAAERDIRQLVGTYAQLTDAQDVDGWLELFAEDAAVELGGNRSVGAAELRTWLTGVLAQKAIRHLFSNATVTVDSPTTATGAMDLLLLADVEGRWAVAATMRYDDRYTKVGDAWLFAERVLTPMMPPRVRA